MQMRTVKATYASAVFAKGSPVTRWWSIGHQHRKSVFKYWVVSRIRWSKD